MNYTQLLKRILILAACSFVGRSAMAQTNVTIPGILPPGKSITIVYSVEVGASAVSGTVIANTASITASGATATNSNTVIFTVVSCPPPTISNGSALTFCSGGSVTLTAVNGDAGDPATAWQWYRDNNPIGGATSATYIATASGVYKVQVTNSCAGTIQSGTVTVTVNPLPTATVAAGAVTACASSTAPVITFTGTSGTAPFTFSYRVNGGTATTVSTVTGNTATLTVSTASAASYTYELLSVSDATTCSQAQTGSVTVTVNARPTAVISGGATICQGGSTNLTLTVTGGGTVSVTIRDNPFTTSLTVGGTGTFSTTVTPSGTGTITYFIFSITDQNGCSNIGSGAPEVIVNPTPSAAISGSTAVCLNAAAPAVTFTGSAGTAPYVFSYKINGGATQTVTTVGGNSTVTVTQPTGSAGTFTYTLVSVADASATQCTQGQTGTVTIVVNPLPAASITGNTTVCRNATAPVVTFTGSGGTAPYTFSYKINGGATQTVTTSVGNSVTVSQSTASAGTFTYTLVSVQDGSSTQCTQAQTGTVTVVVNPLPSAGISGNTAVCLNAAAPAVTFTGSGGTAPYTFSYRINGGATQTVTTSVGNSVTVSQATTSAGTFTYSLVSVQDASSTQCVQAQTGTVTVIVQPLPTAGIGVSAATACRNAAAPTITFTGANGGTASYTFTYMQSDGSTHSVTTAAGNNTATVSVPTSVAGTFTYSLVSVSNGTTGCSQLQSGTVTITVNPLSTATISSSSSALCISGTATVTFTGAGGTGPYTITYTLDNGAPLTVSTPAGAGTQTVALAVPLNSLGAGVHTYTLVSIQDINCTTAVSGTTTITINALPTISSINTGSVCRGTTVALINYAATTQSPNDYRIAWSTTAQAQGFTNTAYAALPGGGFTVSAPAAAAAGIYTATIFVRNANGCESLGTTITLTVNETTITPFVVSVCPNITVANLSYTSTGTPNQYKIDWSAAAVAASFTNVAFTALGSTVSITIPPAMAAGTYTGTLTARNTVTGCVSVGSVFTVTIETTPAFSVNAARAVCVGTTAAVFSYTSSSTPDQYQVQWSAAATGAGFANIAYSSLAAGSFTVTVPANAAPGVYTATVNGRFNSGCTTTAATLTLTVNGNPTLSVTGAQIACRGASSVVFSTSSTGSPDRYRISWSAAAIAASFVNTSLAAFSGTSFSAPVPAAVAPGVYTGTVFAAISGTGCESAGAVFTITVNARPTASISGSTTVCNGGSAILTIILTGTGTISGTLSNGQTFAGAAGTISVTVTPAFSTVYTISSLQDANCSAQPGDLSGSATVNVCVITTITTTNPCYGTANGAIHISVNGSSGPYRVSVGGADFVNVPQSGPVTVSGLTAGSYDIVLMHGNGNVEFLGAQVLADPSPITVSLGLTGTLTCSIRTVRLNITNVQGGGGASYTYSIDGGSFGTSTSYDVGPGVHRVAVKDKNGCSMIAGTVTVTDLSGATLGVPVVTNVTVYGADNGSIAVSASGGTGSYTISLQNSTTGASSSLAAGTGTVTFRNLAYGGYLLTAVDNGGCGSSSRTVEITQPAPVPADLVLTGTPDNTVFGGTSSSVTLVFNFTNLSVNPAAKVKLRVYRPIGYLVTLLNANSYTSPGGTTYTLDNSNWLETADTPLYVEYTLQTPLSGSIFVPKNIAVKITRVTPVKGQFSITGILYATVPESNSTNNTSVHIFLAQ